MNESKIREIAQKARDNRKNQTSQLIGYCFENAQEMSRQLRNENIKHKLHYVGLIEDVIQYCDVNHEDCVHAGKTGEYRNGVPETIEQLPDSANHYIITVPDRDGLVVEVCSEIRDDRFRKIYVGEWPYIDYLPLKDGVKNKESLFSY